jgi:hypothetical protein
MGAENSVETQAPSIVARTHASVENVYDVPGAMSAGMVLDGSATHSPSRQREPSAHGVFSTSHEPLDAGRSVYSSTQSR